MRHYYGTLAVSHLFILYEKDIIFSYMANDKGKNKGMNPINKWYKGADVKESVNSLKNTANNMLSNPNINKKMKKFAKGMKRVLK